MFKEKQDTQNFREKEYIKENLSEIIENKIEIYKEGEENEIIEIDEELQDAIVDYVYDKIYMYNKIKIEGLKEGKKILLYFYKGDLYLTALEEEGKEPQAWFIEDEEIINKVKELISTGRKETSKE